MRTVPPFPHMSKLSWPDLTDCVVLVQAMNEKQTNTEVGAGLDTPAGYATTDLTAVGEGRNTVVRLNLDRAGDSVTGQTVVDPKVRLD